MNPKDGGNTSKHNLNNLSQEIFLQHRILRFEIGELNLPSLIQHLELSTASGENLPPDADLAAPLSSQLWAKPEFMVPETYNDGKHPDAMNKDITVVLDNRQDTSHCIPMCSGTREYIKHKSLKKMYISDEQLHPIELSIYQGVKVHVQGLDSECLS